MEAVIQRQRASYAHFRRLFRAARKLDHIYLNDADKQSFGVAVHPLNLRSDKGATLPGQPQFFEPMQPEVFDRLPGPGFTVRPDPVDIGIIRGLSFALDIHNHLGDEILEEKRLSPDKYSLLCSTRWDTSTYGERSRVGLGENQIPGVSDYEWRVDALYGVDEDPEFPHTVLFSVHSLNIGEGNEQNITRGELVLILKMFMERMVLPMHAEHELYPILMVSFFGLKLRLLQAHFDGEFLHIQCSQFLDLMPDSKEDKDLLLRWILSTPVGNTRVPTKPVACDKVSLPRR